MNTQNATCPPESQLGEFGLGKLDAASADTISQHLETCVDCRERVAGLSGDSFVARLREARPGGGLPQRDRTFVPGGSIAHPDSSTDGTSSESAQGELPKTPAHSGDVGNSPHQVISAPPELANHPDYELLKELGKGGMGTVYLARNRMMDRLEVLKVVSKALLDKPGALERFQQEIRSAARLAHPNIVAAYSVLRPGDLLVFAMEYVRGQDLSQLVKGRGQLPVANAAFYTHQIALGLQHAHDKGMVHRDIKPNNLMLTVDGKKHVVKILDFGLSKATSEKVAGTGLTKSGQMLGTPDYIAPEQMLDAQKADIRADIYSLGCTLYCLLSGGPPFQETSLYGILEAHQKRDARPLNLVRPDVPVELAAVVAKMMAKVPAKRYQTPAEVARALVPFFKPGQAAVTADLPPRAATERSSVADASCAIDGLPASPAAPTSPAVPSSPQCRPIPVATRLAAPVPVSVAAPESEIGISINTGGRKTPRGGWSTLPPWQRYAAAAGAAAFVLMGIVLLVQTPHGTIEIELSDPKANVTVTVDGDNVDIAGLDEPLSLEVREHDLVVRGKDYETITKKFAVIKGRNAPLSITLKKVPPRPDPGPLPPRPDPKLVTAPPSAELEALRRDQIPRETLAAAGGGDPSKAPASLVGVLGEALPIHTDRVNRLAFSADGRWLASASDDNTILLRDAVAGLVRRSLRGHTSGVISVAFSKDSQILVSASRDGTLKLWPMEKEAEPLTLQPKLGEIWGMAVSADGRFLAAGGTNGRISLWKWGQWDSPMEVTPEGQDDWIEFKGPAGRTACLAFSTDGELLAVGRVEDKPDIPVRIYKTSDRKVTLSLTADAEKGRWPLDICFRPDGQYVACFLGAFQAVVWDVTSGTRVAEFPAWQFGSVAFSIDGKTLAVGGTARVYRYDLASKTRLQILSAGHHACFSGIFNPDGNLFAAGFGCGIVHMWDANTWKEKNLEHGHLQHVRALAISPDGGKVLSAGNDDTLRQWDLSHPGSNQIIHQFAAEDLYPPGCVSVAYRPGGKTFALVVRGDGYWREGDETSMTAWDAATLKKRWALPLGLDSVVFSPDGITLAGGCIDGGIGLWSADLGTELHRFPAVGRCAGVSFSGDGTLLAAASWDKNWVKVWNVATGAELHSWQDASMTAAAFRPDGRLLATGDKDGAISVWDLAEGKKQRTLKGHSAQVRSLKFIPDGETLVSSGDDGTIRLWDPEFERAKEVIHLGQSKAPLIFDLDPSGKYLIAAGQGPLIYVLRLPTQNGHEEAISAGP